MIDYEKNVKIKLRILFSGKMAVISMKNTVEKEICLREKEISISQRKWSLRI